MGAFPEAGDPDGGEAGVGGPGPGWASRWRLRAAAADRRVAVRGEADAAAGGAPRGAGRGSAGSSRGARPPRAERSRHNLPAPQQHPVPPHSAGTAGGARPAVPHAPPPPRLSRRKLRLHPRCSPRARVRKGWAAVRVCPLACSPPHLRCMCVLNAASRVFAPGQLELNNLACANGS